MADATVPSPRIYAIAQQAAFAVRLSGIDHASLADFTAARLDRYGDTLTQPGLVSLARVIARNRAVSLLRQQRAARRQLVARATSLATPPLDDDRLTIISRAISLATADISEDQRLLLRLVHVDGLRIRQAAQVLGLDSKDVYRRFSQLNTAVAHRLIELARRDPELRDVLERMRAV